MTETTQTSTAKGGGLGWPVFAVGGLVILGLLWLLAGSSDRALQRGATGFSGLLSWLKTEGYDARAFRGGGTLVRGDLGLRILPLHDTDLEQERETPTTREAVLAETSQIDIRLAIVRHKIEDHPTLLILPKWRAGMPILGAAHKKLLIPEREINRVVRQIGLTGVKTRRDPSGFSERTVTGGRIGLMHAQTLRGTGCEPILGTRDALILGKCPVPEDYETGETAQTHLWLLADPDLMNNHGLSLAANPQVTSAIMAEFDTSLPVLLDLTKIDHTAGDDWFQEPHERTWEDFARMFRWPFTMIWIAFACLGALVLWRAVARYGPVARAMEDSPRASKEISIDAKARLLRLAGQDGPLLADHVKGRLAHLASEILGPHRHTDEAPLELLRRLISRRDPGLAHELAMASDIPGALSPDDIIHRLDQFETCYDKVIHEFGRTPVPR
ncbi:MAG: hypothetical protein AB8B85_16350 [Paracoccaceae bacterium]